MTCLPPTYPYLDLPHASVFCLGPLLFILQSAGIPTLSQSTQPLCILLPMMSRPMSMVLLLSSVPSLRPLHSSHRHDIFLPFPLHRLVLFFETSFLLFFVTLFSLLIFPRLSLVLSLTFFL